MAVSLAQACATPIEREVLGKTWCFSPLTLGDLAEMIRWWEDLPLARAQGRMREYPEIYVGDRAVVLAIQADKDAHERRLASARLQDDASLARLLSECKADFSSLEAVCKLAYLSLKKLHPEITPQEAASVVDAATAVSVQSILDLLTFPAMDQDADLFVSDDEKKTPGGPDFSSERTGGS